MTTRVQRRARSNPRARRRAGQRAPTGGSGHGHRDRSRRRATAAVLWREGPAFKEERERLEERGLARTVLTYEHRHADEVDGEILESAVVPDGNRCDDHGCLALDTAEHLDELVIVPSVLGTSVLIESLVHEEGV